MTFKRISSGTHKRSGTVRCYISDLEAKNPILLMKSADDTWLGRTEKNTREDQKTAGMCLNCCQTAHSSEALHCADPGAAGLPSNPGVSPSRAPLALYHPTNPSALWDWGQANGRHRLQEEPAIHWAGLGSSSTARWQADQNNPSKVTSFLLLFNCNDSVCNTDPIAGGSAPLRKQYSTVWDCDQKLG